MNLTEKQRRAILARYRDGVRVADIAAEFGVSESYPSVLARRRGVSLRFRMDWCDRISDAAERREQRKREASTAGATA